jgi:hypothetical protein
MNIKNTVNTFVIGMLISITVGIIFNDGGMATMTAVCFTGSVIVGIISKKE